MATYLANLSNKKAEFIDEQFVTCPNLLRGGGGSNDNEIMYLNQAAAAAAAMILPGASLPSNCVETRSEMMFIPPISDPMSTSINEHHQHVRYPGQGLSLSLGKQNIPSSLEYHYPNTSLSSDGNELFTNMALYGGNNHIGGAMKVEGFGNPYELQTISSFGSNNNNNTNVFLSSKHLKAVEGLLDEVVNVREALKQPEMNKRQRVQGVVEPSDNDPNGPSGHSETGLNPSSEISPSERQDLQSKKSKLMSMLDEVRFLFLPSLADKKECAMF